MNDRSRDIFKTVSWLVLVVAGIALVVWALFYRSPATAIALGILTMFTWAVWGGFLNWLFSVRRPMMRHLGMRMEDATFQEKEIGASRIADVRRTLEKLYAEQQDDGGSRFGMTLGPFLNFSTLQSQNRESQPLQWTTFELLPGTFENLPTNAVYLLWLHSEDTRTPFAATAQSCQDAEEFYEEDAVSTGHGVKLQVFSRSIEDGTRVINELLALGGANSVYRGQMLEVTTAERTKERTIRVSERPNVPAERIILPNDVLDVLQRSVAGRLKHHRLLARHGHSTKAGVLLHGAPGTGKTLVARHLIGAYEGYTAIVPTGMESQTIREAFRLAGYLHPAMIVIEDVDLLAERRETNANVTGLQELMNEMDGLAQTAETIVLMTTNRPELLEPALASRPGRVSQAIEFPLPDDALRERLLKLFCREADVSAVDLSRWIDRTQGASPAFLEELCKRAIIFAAEREGSDDDDSRVALTDDDFDRAIHDLVVYGGELTSKILGFAKVEGPSDSKGD